MARRDIVVIGASAGGIEAVSTVLRDLPKDLPASVFVVVHIARDSIGYLPKIFSKAGGLPAKNVKRVRGKTPRRVASRRLISI